MLTFKKRIFLEIIILLVLLSGVYVFQHPSILPNLFLIDSRATQQSVSLSVTIGGTAEEDLIVPATGIVEPTDSAIKQTLQKVTGLDVGYEIKMRVYTNSTTPEGFTAPDETEVDQVINYLNITLNDTFIGTATIFFNISDADLGAIDPSDIALFRYTTSWNELTTTVVDSTQDPNSFSATTTAFSRFLIGSKVSGVSAPKGGGALGRGAFVYIDKKSPEPPRRPTVILPEKVKKILKIPLDFIKYKVNYRIVYITATALLLLIIILEIIYYFTTSKKYR